MRKPRKWWRKVLNVVILFAIAGPLDGCDLGPLGDLFG
jgi:hypothetical protein